MFEKPRDPDSGLTLEELSKAAGTTPRTVRFYIVNGLLAPPIGSGPAARYPVGNVARLQLVRAMQDDGVQLAKIGILLETVSDAEVQKRLDMLTGPSARQEELPLSRSPWSSSDSSDRRETSSGVRRSQWEHFVLEPGVELLVRRPLMVSANRRVQKILEYAQSLLATSGNTEGNTK
jgi:DNA-binding transcriptional MerR regulator